MTIRANRRSTPLTIIAVIAAVSVLAVGPAHGAVCSAKSGPKTMALVELYTSEGCSSCPPADRWLSTAFTAGGAGTTAIPLAFHVDY